MAKRDEHLFVFRGDKIAEAARAEADYHAGRLEHWQGRHDAALAKVEETIGAKLARYSVSGGGERVQVVVHHGDPEAWSEFELAGEKLRTHRDAKARYEQDAATYGSQPTAVYELDRDDVRHFRLGGEPREE